MTTAMNLIEEPVREALKHRFKHRGNGNVYKNGYIDRSIHTKCTYCFFNETERESEYLTFEELQYLDLIED